MTTQEQLQVIVNDPYLLQKAAELLLDQDDPLTMMDDDEYLANVTSTLFVQDPRSIPFSPEPSAPESPLSEPSNPSTMPPPSSEPMMQPPSIPTSDETTPTQLPVEL